jgi:hypothetical protein
MTKRFGRNQRRNLREENARLKQQVDHLLPRVTHAEVRIHGLREALKNARSVFVKIGWAEDCDAIRMIDNDLKRLDGRHHHEHAAQ